MINIAIDGPSGAGKSSIAREVSKKMGYIYIDTGAIFRSLAFKALKSRIKINPQNEALLDMLKGTKLDITLADDMQHMMLDGMDVTELIRTPEVSRAASDIAVIGFVRDFVLFLERDLASKNNCIMDGRDIGTVVLPDADVKIFLTASPEARAKRRLLELEAKGVEQSFEQVLADMKYRDKQDSEREVAPLKMADDAYLADTSDNTFEESVALVEDIIKGVIS